MVFKAECNLLTLIMAKNIISNGNRVMKETNLEFQNYSWSQKVRGKGIKLETLDISGNCDRTKEFLDDILYITST